MGVKKRAMAKRILAYENRVVIAEPCAQCGHYPRFRVDSVGVYACCSHCNHYNPSAFFGIRLSVSVDL